MSRYLRPDDPAAVFVSVFKKGSTGAFVGIVLNLSVAVAGPTVTGFVATLYSVFSALLAVPLLGEPLDRTTLASFFLALAGTALGSAPAAAQGSFSDNAIRIGVLNDQSGLYAEYGVDRLNHGIGFGTAAIELLLSRGARDVTAVCLLAAPEGLARLEEAFGAEHERVYGHRAGPDR